MVGSGWIRYGKAVALRSDLVRFGEVGRDKVWQLRFGMVTRGLVRFGSQRSGELRFGKVRCGEAWSG